MSWSTIFGHDAIRESFRSAHDRGRLAHAYLFAGPSGVGKLLFASECAKVLLCESPPETFTACDRCRSCALAAAGTHPDLAYVRTPEDRIELPIDAMREFCSWLGHKAIRGSRKVGIVVDADDFNEESANAFLKSLEEPPPGTTLFLIATSPSVVLPTIRSRCQVVPFSPLDRDAIRKILATRGVAVAAIERAIRQAGGSAGRAIELSDESVSELRAKMIDALGATRFLSSALWEPWNAYVEAAGKDGPGKWRRSSVAVGLAVDLLAQALRLAHDARTEDCDPAEVEKLRRFANRVNSDELAELLYQCVEADYLIDRRVQTGLVIDRVVELIARLTRSRESVSHPR